MNTFDFFWYTNDRERGGYYLTNLPEKFDIHIELTNLEIIDD